MSEVSPALIEAAKVLYLAANEGNIRPNRINEAWEAISFAGPIIAEEYIRMARALLKWELTREPSEGMAAAAFDYEEKCATTPDAIVRSTYAGQYRAMTSHRLREFGVEG
jgi:hypothetical protein